MNYLKWAVAFMVAVVSGAFVDSARASLVLGNTSGQDGEPAGVAPQLLGGDLTDPEDDGDPNANVNYNVVSFFASEEPNFGGAEGAFNVFDNRVGGSNAKWCCGDQSNFPTSPITVGFQLDTPMQLTHFTITSGNDSPERDPRVWSIQGSNDGTTWFDIFVQSDATASIFGNRNETILFDAGNFAGLGFEGDFALPDAYTHFQLITTATGATGGARFQLNELEFFGRVVPIPEPASITLMGLAAAGLVMRRRRTA